MSFDQACPQGGTPTNSEKLPCCCRSITCWALSRYAQWVVERCTDPQQDMNAAQVQLDEVLQVGASSRFKLARGL